MNTSMLKRRRYLIASMLALFAATAGAQSLPGSQWSVLEYNHDRGADSGNWKLSGNVEQGIVLKSMPSGTVLGYGSISYGADSLGRAYNNKVAPAVGIKWTTATASGTIAVGAQVGYDHRFRGLNGGQQPGPVATVYVSTWNGWDLAGSGH